MNESNISIKLVKINLVSLCLSGKMFSKASIFIFIFLTCYLNSVAQISFGVKGGLNVNSMLVKASDPNIKDWSEIGYGFHLGVYSKIPLSKKISIVPEIQYSRRGDVGIKMGYLEIPLMVSYSVAKFLEVQIGINGALKIPSQDGVIDSYNSFDFGLTGGLNFPISNKLTLTGRYYYGLPSVRTVNLTKLVRFIDPNDPLLNPGPDIIQYEYNRSVQFSLGYKIK